MKKLILTLLLALSVVVFPQSVDADEVTFQSAMPFTSVPDQFNVDLQMFDSALGTLTGIEICVTASGYIETNVQDIDMDGNGGTVDGLTHGLLDIGSPAAFAFDFDLVGTNTFADGFDGVLRVDVSGTQTYSIMAADFGFFAAANPGDTFSSLIDLETAEATGSPEVDPDFQTGVVDVGELKVTYTFDAAPVPEPTSLIVVGLAGLVFVTRRQRVV